MKRPRLTQEANVQHAGTAARNLLSGALNEAIRREGPATQDQESSPKKAVVPSSPAKSLNKGGIRRKRRKDPTENSDFHHTFVMKLFDRSVDLAQFRPVTPLYPVCRAWMKNEPSNTNQVPTERSPTPPPPSPSQDQDPELQDIYSLPAPEPVEDGKCPRVPPPRPPPVLQGVDLELQVSDSTPPAILLSNHMVRWWEVRKSWRQASQDNEKRYSKSLSILKEMFDK